MKIVTNLINAEEFKKTVDACEGPVWLQSVYGDHYNLKSALSQYVAIADLLRDRNEDLELFAQYPSDQAKLIEYLRSVNK